MVTHCLELCTVHKEAQVFYQSKLYGIHLWKVKANFYNVQNRKDHVSFKFVNITQHAHTHTQNLIIHISSIMHIYDFTYL